MIKIFKYLKNHKHFLKSLSNTFDHEMGVHVFNMCSMKNLIDAKMKQTKRRKKGIVSHVINFKRRKQQPFKEENNSSTRTPARTKMPTSIKASTLTNHGDTSKIHLIEISRSVSMPRY